MFHHDEPPTGGPMAEVAGARTVFVFVQGRIVWLYQLS